MKRTQSAQRLCRDGRIHMIPRPRTWQESAKLFWRKVNKGAPGECWLWTGRKSGSMGYGGFWANGNHVKAHRFSFELHGTPVPKGFVVRHRCDNPLCVNPDHLLLGTQKQNLHDAIAKGRHSHGEKHTSALLTEREVRAIRSEHVPRKVPYRMLAAKYGVSESTIQGIVERKTWKHLL